MPRPASRLAPLHVVLAPGVLALVSAGLALSASGGVVNVKLNEDRAVPPGPEPTSGYLPGVSWYVLDRVHGTVLYSLDQDVAYTHELFSVPIDRSAPPVKLSDATSGYVWIARLTPDASQAIYSAQRGGPE